MSEIDASSPAMKDDELTRLREALRQSQERERVFAELSGDDHYALRITRAGVLNRVWTTPSFTRLTGYTPEEMGVRGWGSFVHPEDRPIMHKRVSALFAGDTDAREYRIITKGGEIRWLYEVVRPAGPPEADDSLLVYGVARDITEQKRTAAVGERLVVQARTAQRAADAEQQRLRELFVQAPAIIAVTHGPEHVFEFVNPAYERVTGRRAADIVGKTNHAVFPEAPSDNALFTLLDQVYRTGEPYTGTEVPIRYDRDGDGQLEEGVFTFVYQPTKDTTGQVRGILIHGFEVTDEVRARQRNAELAFALRAERDRLQQVLDVLPEAVLIADTTPVFTASNRAARDILGFDAVGNSVPVGADDEAYQVFGARHLDGTPYLSDELPLQRAFLRGETVHGNQLALRNATTGQMHPVLANAAPLRDEHGAVIGAIVVFQDISEIKELERTREEFLSSASHDLKGPLTSIRGYMQLAQRRLGRVPATEAAPVAAALGNIDAATNRMLAIINELTDVTRIRMGVPLDLQQVDTELVALVRRVVEQQQVLAPQQIAIEATVTELIATVDAPRIERVMTNLLTNAIKYSPGAREITVRVEQETVAAEPFATIAVRDHGVGIPPADLPTIWDRFIRAGNVSGRIAGSGIGLASVRDIVAQHGGSVEVESTPGIGSTFTVRLPLTPPDASPRE